MIHDVGSLHKFLRTAKPGEAAIYHIGLLTHDRSSDDRLDALASAVLKAAGFIKGQHNSNKSEEPRFYQTQPILVALVQRRIEKGIVAYLMQRTAKAYKPETPVEQSKETVTVEVA